MSNQLVDFYCNQKFTWLSIDMEKKLTSVCCKADPDRINLSWLKQNPGKIFNTELLKSERQQMLENIPVKSCHTNCWLPESQGFSSQRLEIGQEKTHTLIESQPETLNIILGSSCNLTCSYCCKQYSTAWLHDIKNNGAYMDSNRFNIQPIDQILLRISHNEHKQTESFVTLVNEIRSLRHVKKIVITGGEPFLYNNFDVLMNNIPSTDEILIITGLGVNSNRLKNQIEKIKHLSNLRIAISAENIDKFYEFNRYGNTYQDFEKNLKILTDAGLALNFHSVVSNLTVFGLVDFVNKYNHIPIDYDFCHDPDYLGVNVLDSDSKKKLTKSIEESDITIKDNIIKMLTASPTQEQQKNYSVFINEFARRRNLDLGIFPNSMIEWLNHVV